MTKSEIIVKLQYIFRGLQLSRPQEGALAQVIIGEYDRTTSAEAALASDIATETSRATAAEEALAADLASETARATTAEEEIASNLSSFEETLAYSDSYTAGEFVGAVSITDNALELTKKSISLVYDKDAKTLSLSDGETAFCTIDVTDFILDGLLDKASYDADTKSIIFVFNTDSGKETITVDVSDLVDIYTAGDGLILSDNEFSVVVDADSESFLTVSSSGVKLSGVQDAIDSAVETESTRAKAAEAALKVILQLSGESTHLTLESEVAEDGATTYTIGESDVASASDLEALSETVDNIIDWYEA